MENEFSKPKVLIDLEEYELLKDNEFLEKTNEQLMDLLFALKKKLGYEYVYAMDSKKIRWDFFDYIKDSLHNHKEIMNFITNYINAQLVIENQKSKENLNNDSEK